MDTQVDLGPPHHDYAPRSVPHGIGRGALLLCPDADLIVMHNYGTVSHNEPLAWDAHLQQLLNAHNVPPRRLQHRTPEPIPVTVRCVWETDGEQWQEGRAVAWTSRLVLVHFRDERRLQCNGAWFAAGDVRRRPLEQAATEPTPQQPPPGTRTPPPHQE